jgi:hypothetical protein
MTHKIILKNIFELLVVMAAVIYFVIDALFLSLLKPLVRQIANLKLFQFIAPWIASLGPYPTLILFVVPLVLLEPVKPFSAYLMSSGHFISGMLILAGGEALKIIIVERIFHIGRDKLMTIQAFAWIYNFVTEWLTWVQALPPWQSVKHGVTDFIRWVHKLKHSVGLETWRVQCRSWVIRCVSIQRQRRRLSAIPPIATL